MASELNNSFNPFSIGPPNANASLDIKIPTCPSYPPPVYAITPEPKVHTNRSVSQDSLPKLQSKLTKMKGAKSQIGEVAFSKAINEEMAVSKLQAATAADEHHRIYAGGSTQLSQKVPSDLMRDASDTISLRTLLPVRMCSSSKPSMTSGTKIRANVDSKSSVRSKVSAKSNLSDVSKTAKEIHARSEVASSKLSLHSQGDANFNSESLPKVKSSISNLTKVTKASKESFNQSEAKSISATGVSITSNNSEPKSKLSVKDARRSNLSQVSKVSKAASALSESKSSKLNERSDSSSTLKSRTSVKSSKKSMDISVNYYNSNNVSRTTLQPLESGDKLKGLDHVSRLSVKSSRRDDIVSQSQSQLKRESLSRSSIQQKKDENVSQHSVHSKKEFNALKGIMKTTVSPPPSESNKSLIKEVEELTNRLKAGNGKSFRRFSSLARTYTNTEPEMQCRDDRMSQWFKEAVLS